MIRDLIDCRTLARQTLLTCDLADLGQEMEDARGKSNLMEGENAWSGEVVQRSERFYYGIIIKAPYARLCRGRDYNVYRYLIGI